MLVHSTVCDRRMWDPQWPVLAEAGYRVVRGDFRGFGDTPAADRPYTDAGDVRDLMDALDIAQAALIGSSYGGTVSVEIAARWPDRVTGHGADLRRAARPRAQSRAAGVLGA